MLNRTNTINFYYQVTNSCNCSGLGNSVGELGYHPAEVIVLPVLQVKLLHKPVLLNTVKCWSLVGLLSRVTVPYPRIKLISRARAVPIT